jgi:hypothetical protein
LKRIRDIKITRKKKEPVVPEVEEIEEKLERKRMRKKKLSNEEVWDTFVGLCNEYGVEYGEVVSKAAWRYLEETGGVEEDALSRLRNIATLARQVDEVFSDLSKSDSLKKVEDAAKAAEQVAKLKSSIKGLKDEGVSASDLVKLIKLFKGG